MQVLALIPDGVYSSNTAQNIGVIFHETFRFEKQIAALCKKSFFHIQKIARIRRFLSHEGVKTLVNAFVTSRLDNRNSLLYGLPKNLIQQLQ